MSAGGDLAPRASFSIADDDDGDDDVVWVGSVFVAVVVASWVTSVVVVSISELCDGGCCSCSSPCDCP